MTTTKIIVYLEDEYIIQQAAVRDLEEAFPEYHVAAFSHRDPFLESLEKGSTSQRRRSLDDYDYKDQKFIISPFTLENIVLVIADGELHPGGGKKSYGWNIVAELKEKGYTGPAVYSGSSELPKDKEKLFVGYTRKNGDQLVKDVKRILERGE